MRRGVLLATVSSLIVCVTTSCAGSDEVDGEPQFAPSDLETLIAVRPERPGWSWDETRSRTTEIARSELGRNDTADVQADLTAVNEEAGFVVLRGATWTGEQGQASSSATLSETVSGADEIWRATESFTRRYQEEIERKDIADLEMDLGEGAWGVRQIQRGSGATYSVTAGWRRSNLVLQAHIVCSPCPSDLEDALRNWADAIDREAVRVAARP